MIRRFFILCLIGIQAGCVSGIGGGAGASRGLVNLSGVKAALIRYHDSGEYAREVAVVAGEATRYLQERSERRKTGEKLAVVFDLDETLISNWPSMVRDDFGYVEERWQAWVASAAAPAIVPMREVYLEAKRRDMAVIFVTGRGEGERRATELNLFREGMDDFVQLIMLPVGGERRTNADYKTEVRRKLCERGWVIVANIGDQESDLAGGFAERVFTVPNPFYTTK